jgi:hypothetical protein
MEKISLKVQKQFCEECSLALRRFVGKLDGVESIVVENRAKNTGPLNPGKSATSGCWAQTDSLSASNHDANLFLMPGQLASPQVCMPNDGYRANINR